MAFPDGAIIITGRRFSAIKPGQINATDWKIWQRDLAYAIPNRDPKTAISMRRVPSVGVAEAGLPSTSSGAKLPPPLFARLSRRG